MYIGIRIFCLLRSPQTYCDGNFDQNLISQINSKCSKKQYVKATVTRQKYSLSFIFYVFKMFSVLCGCLLWHYALQHGMKIETWKLSDSNPIGFLFKLCPLYVLHYPIPVLGILYTCIFVLNNKTYSLFNPFVACQWIADLYIIGIKPFGCPPLPADVFHYFAVISLSSLRV